MTLKEHYKFHSIKIYKILFLLIVFIAITVFHTFGRYVGTTSGNNSIDIAKWLLVINGEQILSNTSTLSTPIQLKNSNNETTYIDIGDECYFDITVNPASTEVAVAYTITVDLNDSSMPSGTTIKKYEKYNTTDSNPISITNVDSTATTISGNINLSNAQALSSSDAVRYRVYCQMPDFADLIQNTELSIVPQITVEQIIGNE